MIWRRVELDFVEVQFFFFDQQTDATDKRSPIPGLVSAYRSASMIHRSRYEFHLMPDILLPRNYCDFVCSNESRACRARLMCRGW
jgi:hypothetical protein